MKKETKNLSLILLSSSIGKGFSLLSKIFLTSIIGLNAISLFSLINPLLILVITICSFSLPNVLSYLISFSPNKGKKYFLVSFIIIFLIGIIVIFLLSTFKSFIANKLLHNNDLIPLINSLIIFIPFIMMSSLIKGYFLGKKEVLLTTSSQLFEEGSRLIFIMIFIKYLMNNDTSHNASLIIISLSISEFFQCLYLILFANSKYYKNYKKAINFKSLEFKNTSKELLKIAFPLTLSRLIGTITYFLEPIILSTMLCKILNKNEFALSYSLLSTYIVPLLLLPGFFSVTLSNYLLPNLSSLLKEKKYDKAKKLFIRIISLCAIIGLFFSFVFYFFGNTLLTKLYHIEVNNNYIKILAFPFFIYYLEMPLITSLNALNKNNLTFFTTLISCLIRIVLLITLTPYFKVFSLVIATLISCFTSIILNSIFIYKHLFINNKITTIT